ncbi:hypothetical protein [Desulfosediminicola flagellatus]|uniref:hypothetical protein n=1 Tax=Desulfosediminicola flagellatus TaxID=2569541 RepID=UPI0010ABEDD1|nr:hypothetical protein [Desulfosediminicola flagellatus]
MNTLESLYFPGTEIYSGSQYPVFLLFSKLHVLQPVEDSETADNSADIFKTTGHCQAHTPSPLGDGRDRFLHLIRDIKDRKDDYAAQLSSLTVASMSAKKASIEDSSRGIITSLLGGHGLKTAPEEDNDVQLWQARLVLKIAEILDREEEEVAMQMALLDDEEEGLFKTLHGELADDDENLLDELKQLKEKITLPTAGSIRKRLSAWSRLYNGGKVESQQIWLTHMIEAADTLLERYEDQHNKPAAKIVEFILPANIGWGKAESIELVDSFRQNNSDLLDRIAKALTTFDTDALASLPAEWAHAIEASFPEKMNGRAQLAIYSFTESSIAELCGSKTDDSTGRLLGVISWQE